MIDLKTFVGLALISRIDSHTYFDWVIEYTHGKNNEIGYFKVVENYQIENFCFNELIKRFLIVKIKKKNPVEGKFFSKDQFKKTIKFLNQVKEYQYTNKKKKKFKPNNSNYLQFNVKLFTENFVLFDLLFLGYKYIVRDIQMPMELFNDFLDRGEPKIRFTKDFKVFIAHASEDKEKARSIAQDLSKKGYSVWFDEWEIKVGESIVDKINQGIKKTAFMIVLLSKVSINKPWVNVEMNAGFVKELQMKKVYILPALIEWCEIPPLFSDKKYANFTESYSNGLSEIIQAL